MSFLRSANNGEFFGLGYAFMPIFVVEADSEQMRISLVLISHSCKIRSIEAAFKLLFAVFFRLKLIDAAYDEVVEGRVLTDF